MTGFCRPTRVSEVITALAERPSRLMAGGTDLYPSGVAARHDLAVIWLGRVKALSDIVRDGSAWRLGATATWAAVAQAALPPAFDGLRAAAREVGGVQVQAAGTLGGNLCNASPAADGVPPLLALDAEVELVSARGLRRLPLGAFLLGPRRTARAPDELLTAVLVPDPPPGARGAFVKLGARRRLVISIAMAAVTLAPGPDGRVRAARAAVGACGPVAARLPALEAALEGRPMTPAALAAAVAPEALGPLAPIDDIRATARYRRAAAAEILRRALARAASGDMREAAA